MITVAIPLYNSERYIKRCINSIIAQTFEDFEILIINDCSTDNSIAIIDDVAKKNPSVRIRIINQSQNQGVAMARNQAIDQAKGNYIYFIDSDDTIETDCLSILYEAINNNHADLVISSFCSFKDGDEENRQYTENQYALLNNNEEFYHYTYVSSNNSLFTFFIWNIMFDIHFLRQHNIRFQPLRTGEDQLFFLSMMPYIQRSVILPNITYHYIQRENSLSGYNHQAAISTDDVLKQVNVMNMKFELLKRNNKNIYYADMIFAYIRECIWMMKSIIRNKNRISPMFPHQAIDDLSQPPMSLAQINQIHHKKGFHYAFYCFCKLPLFIKENIIQITLLSK